MVCGPKVKAKIYLFNLFNSTRFVFPSLTRSQTDSDHCLRWYLSLGSAWAPSLYISPFWELFGGEGCDGDEILESGYGKSGNPSSSLSETKYPSDYVGGFTNKESLLDLLSETRAPVGGLESLSFVFKVITPGTAWFFLRIRSSRRLHWFSNLCLWSRWPCSLSQTSSRGGSQ